MEHIFKDLEGESDDMSVYALGYEAADVSGDTAEEIAFAELSERVSAARLVY